MILKRSLIALGTQQLLVAALLASAALVASPAISAAPQASVVLNEAQKATVVAHVREMMAARVASDRQPSISVALFDRSGIIWSGAEGFADAARKVPASPTLIYRAGSTSKLFTDLMIMQEVERGRIDLDADIRTYLPDFQPANPFGVPITARQLTSHRSGLVREPGIGSYFDEGDPGSAAVTASLNKTALVAAPGTLQKYSNAGIVVLGRLLEVVTGKPYDQLVRERIFDRAGMPDSRFTVAGLGDRLAYAEMQAYASPREPAPVFDLGLKAAGSLTATASDLARFGIALLNGGEGPGGRIVTPETLTQMRKIQFARPGQTKGYGLGFALTQFEGHDRVGHGGAIYGYTTEFTMLPEMGIGVVVMGTVDGGQSPFDIADYALSAMLAAAKGAPIAPPAATPGPLPAATAKLLAGRYAANGRSIFVRSIDGVSYYEAPDSAGEIRSLNGKPVLVADIAALGAPTFDAAGSWIDLGGVRYMRTPQPRPAPPSAALAPLIGVYTKNVNRIIVYERDGKPHAVIEGSYEPVTFDGPNTLKFSDHALLYAAEALHFHRGPDGRAAWVDINGIRFDRMDDPPTRFTDAERAATGARVAALRIEAEKASPPAEQGPFLKSDLVNLRKLDPTLKFDIRYATDNNFLGTPVYREPIAYLQRPVAEALVRAHRRLAASGLGIVVFDGYRPWSVTKVFWDMTPEDKKEFVANPADGSRHNRGAAVDVGLFDRKTGKLVDTTSEYDETTVQSYSAFVGGSDLHRWRRDKLFAAMTAERLNIYPYEWWHFDYADWRRYGIGNRHLDKTPQR